MRARTLLAALLSALCAFGGAMATASAQRTVASTRVIDLRLPGDARTTARVAVHVPAGLDARERFTVVLWLHGWGDCAAAFVREGAFDARECDRRGSLTGLGGGRLHDAAGARSILVAPQIGAGHDLGLARPGGLRRLLVALLQGPVGAMLGGPRTLDDVEGVVLAAHSRGARTLDRLLAVGGVTDRVRALLLFDGVMRAYNSHARWLEGAPAGRIGVVTGEVPSALVYGRMLASAWARRHPGEASFREEPFEEALRTHRVAVVHSEMDHAAIPAAYFLPALRALGLPPRTDAE